MTEQEIINNEVQIRLARQDEKFDAVMARVDMLVGEMRDFKNETRQQNLLRAKEISELGKKHDADIKEINTRIDEKFERLLSQIQNMAIAAVGVGAVVAAVVSIMKP